MKCRKKGFGIMEVLVAAAVMGFMLMGIYTLQAGNRDVLLRIRGRDGANEVAREVIDSLSAVGVASLHGTSVDDNGFETIVIPKQRKWVGQPGVVAHDIVVDYSVNVRIAPEETYQNMEISKFGTYKHVYAKRLDLTVTWRYKNTPFSIKVASVVR